MAFPAVLRALPLRLIGFGFLAAFASSVGQTFFIALSNLPFREEHGLSNAEFASVYGVATLLSAATMLFVGRAIDRIDLRLYLTLSILVLTAGAAAVGLSAHFAVFAIGLYLLRLGGQGLMSHIAAVSVARSAGRSKGKSTAIALTGHAAGEVLLPVLWTVVIGYIGWRTGWSIAAIALVAAVLPLALVLLPPDARAVPAGDAGLGGEAAKAGSLFKDPRFPALVACAILPGTFGTAIVFHLLALTTFLGPADPAAALAIPALAAGAVVGGLGGGVLVDRFGGRIILISGVGPLALGCFVFAGSFGFVGLAAALFLVGVAGGAVNAASAPAWVDLFGIHRVGRARSFQTFAMVAGSAIGPVSYGLAMDAGVGTGMILTASGAVVLAVMATAQVVLRAADRSQRAADAA